MQHLCPISKPAEPSYFLITQVTWGLVSEENSFWKSVFYYSLLGISGLHVWNHVTARLHVRNSVLLLPQATAWTVRRDERKGAVCNRLAIFVCS